MYYLGIVQAEASQIKDIFASIKREYGNGEKHQNHILGHNDGEGDGTEIREVGSKNKNQWNKFKKEVVGKSAKRGPMR